MTSAAVQNHNGIRAFAASVPNVSFFPFFLSPSDMPRRNQEKWGGREIWNEARIADAAQAELNAMDVLFLSLPRTLSSEREKSGVFLFCCRFSCLCERDRECSDMFSTQASEFCCCCFSISSCLDLLQRARFDRVFFCALLRGSNE